MNRHKLSRLNLFQYALEGALTIRVVDWEYLLEKEKATIEKDIKEIRRRIKIVEKQSRTHDPENLP